MCSRGWPRPCERSRSSAREATKPHAPANRGATLGGDTLADMATAGNRLLATSAPGGGPYSHTYAHGNMTAMPHLSSMAWNHDDGLRERESLHISETKTVENEDPVSSPEVIWRYPARQPRSPARESFAEAYAGWVTGASIPEPIRKWFDSEAARQRGSETQMPALSRQS
jgi:hypothetical protein